MKMGIIPKKHCLREPSQLIKFFILFGCAIFTTLQVAQCVQKFVYPPASTHSEYILNSSIRYPYITICRRPGFKIELFRNFNMYVSSLKSSFAFRNFNFSQHTLTEFFETTTYSFNELFGQFGFASQGNSAFRSNLKIITSFHLDRGRCFTFKPLITSNSFSVSGGYLFQLINNVSDQRINEIGIGPHGYQIYLHDSNEAVTSNQDEPNNFLEYLDLGAAEDMRVKFDIQEFGRMPTKDNLCKPQKGYSKSKCEEYCINEQIARKYNCTTPWLVFSSNKKYNECNSYMLVRNLTRTYANFRELYIENCDCPMACNFTVYKTSIIHRRGIEASNSIISLYCTNLFFRMSEVLGYDWNQLLSDIGGSLGFLLGLSVISLICICEEICQLLFKWIFKNKKSLKEDEISNAHTDITDKDGCDELKSDNINKLNLPDKKHDYTNIKDFAAEYNYYKKDSELKINDNNSLKY